MQTFNFSLHTKVSTWFETEFEIKANNYQEAKIKAIEFYKSGETDSISWNEIDNSQEILTVQDNFGEATQEIISEKDLSSIWDNTKS
jgi:hypothetical protein